MGRRRKRKREGGTTYINGCGENKERRKRKEKESSKGIEGMMVDRVRKGFERKRRKRKWM